MPNGPGAFRGGHSCSSADGWGCTRKWGSVCTRYAEIGDKGPARTKNYPWVDKIEAPIGAQAIATYEGVGETLEAKGGGLENLLRFHLYQLDKRFFPVFDSIRRHYEPKDPTPSTAVGMGAFDPERSVRFNIDAIALNPEAAKTLGKRMAHEGSKAHSAAAHFSHVVGAGPYLFVAGQIPTDTSKPGSPLICNYPDIPKRGRFLSRRPEPRGQQKRPHRRADVVRLRPDPQTSGRLGVFARKHPEPDRLSRGHARFPHLPPGSRAVFPERPARPHGDAGGGSRPQGGKDRDRTHGANEQEQDKARGASG